MSARAIFTPERTVLLLSLAALGTAGLLGASLVSRNTKSQPETVAAPRRSVGVNLGRVIHSSSEVPVSGQGFLPVEEAEGIGPHRRALMAIAATDSAVAAALEERRSDEGELGGFVWPTSVTRLNSGFGFRVNPISGDESQFHRGVDIAVGLGTEVTAASDGVVSFARWTNSSGNTIVITHPDGWSTRYAHLMRVSVRDGEMVRAGQRIGLSGDTGRQSTGPHLHFEVWKGGRAVDPITLDYRHHIRTAVALTDEETHPDSAVGSIDEASSEAAESFDLD
jgi:murein DD-endopeptidase MepM/ murein hydrolase activator NlpD